MLKTGMVSCSSKCRRQSSEVENKDFLKWNTGNVFSEPRSLNVSIIWSLGSGKHKSVLIFSVCINLS